jgi:hypothetical protein
VRRKPQAFAAVAVGIYIYGSIALFVGEEAGGRSRSYDDYD